MRKTRTVMDRLWSRVVKGGPDECWEYQGARARGYGRIYGNLQIAVGGGKAMQVTRAVYESIHGPIPSGLIVMHTCDNRPCCNPAHLKLGTKQDNSLDMHNKGRWSNQYRAKLKPGRLSFKGILSGCP